MRIIGIFKVVAGKRVSAWEVRVRRGKRLLTWYFATKSEAHREIARLKREVVEG